MLTPKEEPKRIKLVLIVQHEKIVYEYGQKDKIMKITCIRKSIIELVFGIAADRGLINN